MLLGRFFSLVLPSDNTLQSLRFYLQLGFGVAPDSGIDSIADAVVGDGRILIGLGRKSLAAPTFVFLCPGFAARISAFERAGIEIDSVSVGSETLNQLFGRLPGGQHIHLIEARTHSPIAATTPLPGWFDEIGLAVTDLRTDQWQNLGFVALEVPASPWPRIALTSDAVSIGLHGRGKCYGPWLSYQCDDMIGLRRRLAELGIEEDPQWAADLDREKHIVVISPEGTPLVITQSD